MEIITASVLAWAAGLNAYIPLLGLGLLARFTPLINLPESWAWLTSDTALIIVGILLVVELLVDKVPGVDTINDMLQTVIRPAAGGMAFSAGVGTETFSVENPEAFTNSETWVPIVTGIVIALVPHIMKLLSRAVVNTASLGTGAPVMSAAEDVSAVSLTLLALIVPVLALLLLVLTVFMLVRRFKKKKARSKKTEPQS